VRPSGNQVPLTLLDNADAALQAELLEAVERVAAKAAFTLGPEVEAFEAEFAGYCGTGEAVGVASGTDALALAFRALGVGPGDEVLVPANSFVATAEAVSLAGATPRFADVDPATRLMTAETAEPAIGPRTRAIVSVHLYGAVADLGPLLELASERGVPLVEDAAQAHGARHGGRRAGAVGICGCFSFYPAKNLGAWGDGGAVTTDDPELADRIRLLRAHGERPRYHHSVVGTTARLDAIQAAVLRVKLRRLEGWNDERRRVGAELTDALSGSPIELPAVDELEDHVFHQYVIASPGRDALRQRLEEAGISTGVHYPVPIHLTGAYASLDTAPPSLPVCERLAETVLSLPMFPGMQNETVGRIANVIQRAESELGTSIGAF
jgi:dTDP-3-amino-3,4,6-trideoxy-alpha-D-glucose transaminase